MGEGRQAPCNFDLGFVSMQGTGIATTATPLPGALPLMGTALAGGFVPATSSSGARAKSCERYAITAPPEQESTCYDGNSLVVGTNSCSRICEGAVPGDRAGHDS